MHITRLVWKDMRRLRSSQDILVNGIQAFSGVEKRGALFS